MPTFAQLQKLIKLITPLGAVLSAFLAVAQWHEQNRIARDAVERRLTTEWIDHLATFVREPALRPYFFESRNISLASDSVERSKVIALADVYLERMDDIYGAAEDTWAANEISGWLNAFRDAFRNSPVLCARLKETAGHFDYIVENVIREKVGKQDKLIVCLAEFS